MKKVRLIFSVISLLALGSCATNPEKEGLIGPELKEDQVEAQSDRHSRNEKDPGEVNVEVLKYRKKF